MERKVKYKKLLIMPIIVIIILISSTLAFYRWNSNQNIDAAMSLSGLDAFIHYNKGTDVLTGTLLPSTDYTGGISTEIELWKDPSAEFRVIYGHIYMDITTIGPNLAQEEALKWAITTNDKILSTGDFVGQSEGNSIALKINIPLSPDKQLFKIYIWLDESMDINYDIEGESISTIIRAEATEISTMYLNYCSDNNITNFKECLIRSDSYTDYDNALVNIDYKTSNLDFTNLDTIEPSNYYVPLITEYNYDINSNSYMASTTNTSFTYVVESSLVYNGENVPEYITFNNTTSKYTYTNAQTGGIEDIITTEEDIQNGRYKYTCLNSNSNGNCNNLYIIYSYKYNTDAKRYELKSGYTYSNRNIGGTTESSGLFKTVDGYSIDTNNDGDIDSNFTYFYRGDVRNNWVEYAGSLWRIVRINGNGSIRMIYSGSSEEGASHTGKYASIKNSNGSYNSAYSTTSSKTGQRYQYGSTYVGYMYNPSLVLMSTPKYELSSSNNLEKFPVFRNIYNSYKYYIFNDFNLNSNCSLEDETCTMTCTNYNPDIGVGDNCIFSAWRDLAINSNNYDTSGVGSTSNWYTYTNDYKYTCWGASISTIDGDTLIVKCPIVSEVLGVQKSGNTINEITAIVRYHGLFSESEESSNSNIEDSNAKYEVDYWYEKNILNKYDNSGNLLSNYLSDEIFCNDRSLITGNGYNFDLGNVNNLYGPHYRNTSKMSPSLICSNNKDKFTVSNENGNGDLKYPIALITVDEVALAGAVFNVANHNFYLYTGQGYWTMSPVQFNVYDSTASVYFVTTTGCIGHYFTISVPYMNGIRPVINLSSEVLYSSGSGTEEDPYQINLKK